MHSLIETFVIILLDGQVNIKTVTGFYQLQYLIVKQMYNNIFYIIKYGNYIRDPVHFYSIQVVFISVIEKKE